MEGVKLRDELKSAGSSLEGPMFFVLVTAVCLGLVHDRDFPFRSTGVNVDRTF